MGVIGIGSPDLKWEKNNAFNLGLDLTLLGSFIALTLDYYTRKTNDLLMNKRISYVQAVMPIVGSLPYYFANVGSLKK
ncbi:TonB-dependent receptor [Bacteroides fragilis]|nr:TonB-dependent receptor [Bacteroides fragilis]